MNYNILIVDDEIGILESLSGILQDEGYSTITASNGNEAIKNFQDNDINLVLLDVQLPDINGVEVLRKIKEIEPDIPVIMISGKATIRIAVDSTKLGAYDFIEKPFSPEEKIDKMLLTIKQAIERQQLEQENRAFRSRENKKWTMVGQSPPALRLYEQISKAAPSKGRVLITGENGTGKELVARAIHQQSPRSSARFVEVNCAAIPQDLIESEMFGHEKGSFTGAGSRQIGKFELANGGTLFLDEIGDMSLSAQSKVLRAIEEGEIQRIGGTRTIKLDVRIISATNKSLEKEIEKGNFRQDLYYRLNVIPIHVPPLRERKEDIPLLVKHFMEQFCSENGKPMKKISPIALNLLMDYNWPGNIRELRNIVERLIILVDANTIEYSHVLSALHVKYINNMDYGEKSLKEMLDEYEKKILIAELDANGGNVSQTAKKLKIDRANLHRKLRSYGILKADSDSYTADKE